MTEEQAYRKGYRAGLDASRGVCTPVTKGNTTTCSVCGSDGIVKSWTELRGWGGELVHMQAEPEQAIEATLGPREQPPYDELIEALRRDWNIEASWDGLRRFWYVGLTDEGVRKRDEREATLGRGELERENAKLRELVRDMWRDGMCECDERGACAECEYHFPDRMRELGIEVVSA